MKSKLFFLIFFFSFAFVGSAYALTLDKESYCENEDVLITALTGGTAKNIWLYPYQTAASCRYYGTHNCATGASTQVASLPIPAQDDGGNQQTFGTAVVLGENTYTIVETTTAQDCGSLSLANCLASGGYTDDVVFTMLDSCSGPVATSSILGVSELGSGSIVVTMFGVGSVFALAAGLLYRALRPLSYKTA